MSDITSTNVEINVKVNFYHVTRESVMQATPVDIALSPSELVRRDQVSYFPIEECYKMTQKKL